jgi:hypothetical protein
MKDYLKEACQARKIKREKLNTTIKNRQHEIA